MHDIYSFSSSRFEALMTFFRNYCPKYFWILRGKGIGYNGYRKEGDNVMWVFFCFSCVHVVIWVFGLYVRIDFFNSVFDVVGMDYEYLITGFNSIDF